MPSTNASWSEAEKLALMVSIVGSLGAPKWNQVKLPAGRSQMACKHVYRAAMEEAKGIAMGDNQNAEAIKKRSRKSPSTKDAKGKRVHEEEQANESDDSQAGERKTKKIKMEDEEECKTSKANEI
ncbi:MAG: hypothetical protein Q9209_000079 [Squamulea sp. 1 TL-2023]